VKLDPLEARLRPVDKCFRKKFEHQRNDAGPKGEGKDSLSSGAKDDETVTPLWGEYHQGCVIGELKQTIYCVITFCFNQGAQATNMDVGR
jgi:hypothetical protein